MRTGAPGHGVGEGCPASVHPTLRGAPAPGPQDSMGCTGDLGGVSLSGRRVGSALSQAADSPATWEKQWP